MLHRKWMEGVVIIHVPRFCEVESRTDVLRRALVGNGERSETLLVPRGDLRWVAKTCSLSALIAFGADVELSSGVWRWQTWIEVICKPSVDTTKRPPMSLRTRYHFMIGEFSM